MGSSVQFQSTGDFMGSKFYELLNLQGLSYKCAYDYLTNKINFSIWQGKDRTQSQNTNSFIIFSTEFNNIANIDITTDESNYRNYAVVGGSGDGDERIYVTVDLSNGGYKKKIFLDKKSIRYDQEEQTLAEYKAELETEGKKEMLKYQLQNNIDIDTKNSGYEYMVDYDLGDKCDIIISDLNLSLEARIIEIYEVLKENTHTIELILGDKKITNYEKARLTK